MKDEMLSILVLIILNELFEPVLEAFLAADTDKRRSAYHIPFLLLLAAEQQLCYFPETILLLRPFYSLIDHLILIL